jgi:hypothetical protein
MRDSKLSDIRRTQSLVSERGVKSEKSEKGIDDAVRMVQKLEKGARLAKADIKSAFRLLRIWPGDFDQLGFSFSGNFYFDKYLPMGAAVVMMCAIVVLVNN